MNEAVFAKTILKNTLPVRKRLHIMLQAVIVMLVLALSVPLVRWISKEKKAGENYMHMKIADLSSYDPYIFHKVYIPVADCGGIFVSLGELSHERYWDVVFGGNYEVRFLKNSTKAGIAEIRSTGEFPGNLDTVQPKAVIVCPNEAVNSGYDAMLFLPKSGRNFFLSYLAPVKSPEESLVMEPVEPIKPEAFKLGGEYVEKGTPYDVTGIFAFLDKVQDNEIILLLESASSFLDASPSSIVNDVGRTVAVFPDNTTLEANTSGERMLVEYRLPLLSKDFEISDLYVCYRYNGSAEIKKAKVNPFKPVNDEVYNGTLIRLKDNMSEFPKVREENNVVSLEGKNVVLEKPLFIPAGKKLLLKAGQVMDLRNNSFILSRSPIFVEGTVDKPVILTSTDNSANSGLVVLQAKERSSLNYLICDNLGEVGSGIWHLTGAVTFYESDVDFNYCQFINNRSEDGLNTIRSDISIKNCTFANTRYDAFDSDFCTGVFENCHFESTGNDGLDVSTSTMTIRNISFKNIHDKALSVGERSTVNAEKLFAENVLVGLGAKDSSMLTASDVTIKDAVIGLCSYLKKPEFGPSSITVNGYSFKGAIDFKYLIESKDTLIVNGEQWRPMNKKKEALIIRKMINEEPIK